MFVTIQFFLHFSLAALDSILDGTSPFNLDNKELKNPSTESNAKGIECYNECVFDPSCKSVCKY